MARAHWMLAIQASMPILLVVVDVVRGTEGRDETQRPALKEGGGRSFGADYHSA